MQASRPPPPEQPADTSDGAEPDSHRIEAPVVPVAPILRWTGFLAGLGCVLGLQWDPEFSLGIALGAFIASANILALGRGISRMLTHAVRAQHEHGAESRKRPASGLSSLVRMPALMVALVGILWYMPARPEGLAVGMTIALAATGIAIYRGARKLPSNAS